MPKGPRDRVHGRSGVTSHQSRPAHHGRAQGSLGGGRGRVRQRYRLRRPPEALRHRPEAMRGRYSPAVCTGVREERIEGNPAREHVSTSYVERQDLTMRMHMRRFTRLTNAFSKKFENHAHMVALLHRLVQLRASAQGAPTPPNDGGGDRRSALVDRGHRRLGRGRRAEARAARAVQKAGGGLEQGDPISQPSSGSTMLLLLRQVMAGQCR
jgi:hypothetical protein